MLPELKFAVRGILFATMLLLQTSACLWGQTTVEVRVNHKNDDAEEDSGGSIERQNDTIGLGQMQWVGFKFESVAIPPEANITNAYVELIAADSNTEATNLTLFAEDADNAGNISNSSNYLSNRSKTSAFVVWNNVANWSGGQTYQTPDIKTVIQELVDRSGWSSGNGILILIRSDDLNGRRLVVAHDDSSSDAALLYVEYDDGQGDDDPVPVNKIYLSTAGNATLGGLTFNDEDVVRYDAPNDVAVMQLDGSSVISGSGEVDAVHVRPNGKIVLSTGGNAQIGSLSFTQDDLVEYDPNTGAATLIFAGDNVFSGGEQINAVSMLPSGHFVLSTNGNSQIGSLSFGKDDLVQYDPNTGTATLLLDGGSTFSANENIDAVHVASSGKIILSTTNNAQIGSLSFGRQDLVEYDPNTGTATLYFAGDERFANSNEQLDAVSIEEPPEGAHWKLDETTGTTAADSSGNGHDGSLQGFSFDASSVASCATGAALMFDGANDCVTATGYQGIVGELPRTVAAWIKTSTTGSVISWGANADGQQWVLRVQSDFGQAGSLAIDVGNGHVAGSTDLRDDQWHHVAAVLPAGSSDVADVLLYVDGQLQTVSTVQSQSITTAASSDVKIGRDHQSRFFAGQLADVRVVDYDLSAAQINELLGLIGHWKLDDATGQVAVDSSASGNHGTLNGSATWATGGQLGGALEVHAASGDYVSIPPDAALDPPSDFTVMGWFKLAADFGSGSNLSQILLEKYKDNTENMVVALAGSDFNDPDVADGSLVFKLNDANGHRFVWTSRTSWTAGTWYHFAVLADADDSPSTMIFVDGMDDTAGNSGNGSVAKLDYSSGIRLGGRSAEQLSGDRFLDGHLDDIRLYNRQLCPHEIARLSAGSGFTGVRVLSWVEVK